MISSPYWSFRHVLVNWAALSRRFWVGHCFSVFFHHSSGKLSILIHICLPIDQPTVEFLLRLIINYKGCRNNKCCHGLHRKGSSKKRRKLAEMFLCLQVTSTPQICTPPSPCNSSADSIGSTGTTYSTKEGRQHFLSARSPFPVSTRDSHSCHLQRNPGIWVPWKSKAGTSYLIIRFSLTFDEEKIWESSSSFGCTPVYEPANGNWYWWISPCSLSNCRTAYEDVTNMKLGTNKLNVKYYFSTLPKNSNGSLRWFSGRCDILHIPAKQIRAFSIRDLLQAQINQRIVSQWLSWEEKA